MEADTKTYVDDELKQAMRFSTAKYGDTPTDVQQLTPKGYVDGQISSVVASIIAVIPTPAIPAVFGTGSDGAVVLDGTTSYSFASIISSFFYSQTRDVYATTLLVNNGVSWKPNLYRTFASSVLTINGASVLAKGNDATRVGGASILAGYFPSIVAGVDGGGGGNGGVGSGGATGGEGVIGTSLTHSFGKSGLGTRSATAINGGPAGAFPGGAGGASAVGGIATPTIIQPIPIWGTTYFLDVDANGATMKMTGSAGSASGPGGGGGADTTGVNTGGKGGAGGGSGSAGGTIALYAKAIQLQPGSTIDVRGGNAGNGANGNAPTGSNPGQTGGGAGGNGGSGGQGGYVVLQCATLVNNASILTSGGTLGTGGSGSAGINGGGAGGDGLAGFSGNAGSVMTFMVTG